MTNRKVVIVSGLSGAGKGSILRTFEDLGFDAVDNPPMPIVATLISQSARPLAIGLDARSQGFDPAAILQIIKDLDKSVNVASELIYARADDTVLQRRFTETRRRHPLATEGSVLDGIRSETKLTRPLLEQADWVVDTSAMTPAALRREIELRFRHDGDREDARRAMAVTVVSFAFPAGLPPEADMVFDARFLNNPHYVPGLSSKTGLDDEVGAYVEADADFARFFCSIIDLCRLVFPRFVTEGKKYVTVAIGCTGGRHRSVHIAKLLGISLKPTLDNAGRHDGWSVLVRHRDISQPPVEVDEAHPRDLNVKPDLRASNESWSV